MPYQLPPDSSAERRARLSRWLTFGLAAALVALVSYLAYVGYEGSRQLADPPNRSGDCRTPGTMGWEYEAINYELAADAELESETNRRECARQGPPAGDRVRVDSVALAGWYVPAAADAGPAGPTIILTHGWGSNKSSMLDRAAFLHDRYNLLLFDLRNHGQSSVAATTQGVREAADLRAMVDWLEREKGPERIAVLGVSMGGATALAEAGGDDRIDAVIAESTHATLANAAQARLDRSGYPLAVPGSWAILLGSLIRTGEDVSAADPIQSVGRLDERPFLLVHAGEDDSIGPDDAPSLVAAAEEAGVPAELHVCEGAGHAMADEVCPEEYAGWVLGFLERALVEA